MKLVHQWSILAGAALALAGPGLADDASAPNPVRAYVLDAGARALTALELPSGQRLGSVPLSGEPWGMVQSPDGSRLLVFDRGPGEDKGERGYKARGRSSVTIVDPTGLTAVGHVELGFGLEPGRWYFSPDSRRLTVLCPGYEAKTPAEALPRELVTVDVAEGREVGRLALDPGSVPIVASKDGRTLPLIQGLPRSKKFPYPQSRLMVVDPAGPSMRATLDLGTWTNLYTDGAQFYLLDPGKPDRNPQKNRNGTVQVASLEAGTLAGTFDAGREPRGLYQDEEGEQVFIPSDGPPGSPTGQLRVVRGVAVVATLDVAANPKLLKREGGVVYVVGEKAVTLVDPVALKVTATIPLQLGGDTLVDDDDQPSELRVSPDGKRAFILYGGNNKVVTLDLGTNQAIGMTKTGRGGKKLFGNLMGGMFGMAGYLAAGYAPFFYVGPSMLAVRPDGGYAYAINRQTKDVTVVDGATGKSVEMIAGNGYDLRLLEGGQVLAVVSGSELHLIDTRQNRKTADVAVPDLRDLWVSPDRSLAVALGKQLVLVLDGVSGAELARLTDFVQPESIVFADAR